LLFLPITKQQRILQLVIYNLNSTSNKDSLLLDSSGTSITAFGTKGSLGSWTNDQLKSAINHNSNSERLLNVIPKIDINVKGVNVDAFTGWRNETSSNLKAQQEELKNRGIVYEAPHSAGGASTEMIKNASIDDGNWKVKNWFGLAFRIE
jgi:hypothetical protein